MEITVLGSGAAYPRAGGACSGFLVASNGTNVWLDAGNGTFGRLLEHISYRDLDALVLTHGHGDHVADVVPLMYALGFDPELPPSTLPVYAPFDVAPMLKSPLGTMSKEMFKKVFEFRPIDRGFEVGDVRFVPFKTQHPAETFGVRMESDRAVAVYTSDTGLFPDLAGVCRDADLLICEATYVDGIEAERGVHMWAREAGRVAAEAKVKRLVLTHIWSTLDPDRAVAEASEEFPGNVEAAVEGNRYTI
jgi:ribonuclease BN (tRNA processing enzyme)